MDGRLAIYSGAVFAGVLIAGVLVIRPGFGSDSGGSAVNSADSAGSSGQTGGSGGLVASPANVVRGELDDDHEEDDD